MTAALTPSARYAQDLAREGFSTDAAQQQAIDALQGLYDELLARPPVRRLGSSRLRWPAVKGLYFWGGVGRGKTYLMDIFFEALPFSRKRRTHFHRFLLDVHERRRKYPDQRDPLGKVADEIAQEARVLCFDEFFVSDIADAMILGRLTEALFAQGVTLVATSNIAPDGLYRDGLQRQNFLPAIATLQKNVRVLNVDGGTDYRLRQLNDAQLWLVGGPEHAHAPLGGWFRRLAHGEGESNATLSIHSREITARQRAEGVAWFDFSELCEGPRGAADYIELARTHHTLIVSGIPVLTVLHENEARRFITLIDELYDRNVKLIAAAAVEAAAVYTGDRLTFEFQRTLSRLTEMRSAEYLAQPHRP